MIPREKMHSMTDEEIRNGGGSVFYVKSKNGVCRIMSNYVMRPIQYGKDFEGDKLIRRRTREEAENDQIP
jgi:hypothetical protein